MTKDLKRLGLYYGYLLLAWGAFRYFVRLPEMIEELWFKPVIWLVPLFWWHLSLNKKIELFGGKVSKTVGWGLLGGGFYFIILQVLMTKRLVISLDGFGIALITTIVEGLVFSGVILGLLVKETKREGLSLIVNGLAFATIYLPVNIFVRGFNQDLSLEAFILAFFVALINGLLRLKAKNVGAAMMANLVYLLLI